jgi:FtsH-binding integral membrane protein
MFETLLSKTLFILAVSLIFCVLGAYGVLKHFRKAYDSGKEYVTARVNDAGELDLIVETSILYRIFWPALIFNIITFIGLQFCKNLENWNFILMSLFTFSDGITLGIVLISLDENIGVKVTSLTAITTLLASLIGMYSGIDFSFLEEFLFISLCVLICISFFRIFVSINGTKRKLCAGFGILIFIGYLLFDFNSLSKAQDVEVLNNWNTALDFAINIYLDIINLFLDILDMLSD